MLLKILSTLKVIRPRRGTLVAPVGVCLPVPKALNAPISLETRREESEHRGGEIHGAWKILSRIYRQVGCVSLPRCVPRGKTACSLDVYREMHACTQSRSTPAYRAGFAGLQHRLRRGFQRQRNRERASIRFRRSYEKFSCKAPLAHSPTNIHTLTYREKREPIGRGDMHTIKKNVCAFYEHFFVRTLAFLSCRFFHFWLR